MSNNELTTITEFAIETGFNRERIRSLCKYNDMKLGFKSIPGKAPQRALNTSQMNIIKAYINRKDANKTDKKTEQKIIVLGNQKGGVSKTSTARDVGAALSLEGKSVLLVDGDPQGSLSLALHNKPIKKGYTVLDAMLGNKTIDDIIIRLDKYDLLPANLGMATADIELSKELSGGVTLLRRLLENTNYDYVLIDMPPSLGKISINCLAAGDYLIMPCKVEDLCMLGLNLLIETINNVKKTLNPNLKILGAVATLYDRGDAYHREGYKILKDYFKSTMFETVMRKNTHVARAVRSKQDIFSYNDTSPGAKDIKALTKEILKKIGE